MHPVRILSLNVLLAFSLGGCSLFSNDSGPQGMRVEPSAGVTHGGPAAMLHYELGRYHHARLDYKRAVEGYGQALQADPTHVEARNGLAIVLAMQGQHDQALKELAAAIALAPQAAHLHNNLGYVHMLRGAHAEAAAAFSLATRLDPSNKRAAENLAAAQAKMQAAGIAVPEARPARADNAPPARSAPTPVHTETAGDSQPRRIVPVSNQIYELKAAAAPKPAFTAPAAAQEVIAATSPASAPAPALAPAARIISGAQQPAVAAMQPLPVARTTPPAAPRDSAAKAPPLRAYQLEISNGMGLNGFAKAVSIRLATKGIRTTRLTNQLPFEQPLTHIQYREGYAEAAAEIASRLRPDVPLAPSTTLSERSDVRLVLGRDQWTVSALLRRPDGAPVHVASVDRNRE